MCDSQHQSEETQSQSQRLMFCQLLGLLSFVTMTHMRQRKPCNKVQLLTNTPLRHLLSCVSCIFQQWLLLTLSWDLGLNFQNTFLCLNLGFVSVYFIVFRENILVWGGRGGILYSSVALSIKLCVYFSIKQLKRKL